MIFPIILRIIFSMFQKRKLRLFLSPRVSEEFELRSSEPNSIFCRYAMCLLGAGESNWSKICLTWNAVDNSTYIYTSRSFRTNLIWLLYNSFKYPKTSSIWHLYLISIWLWQDLLKKYYFYYQILRLSLSSQQFAQLKIGLLRHLICIY